MTRSALAAVLAVAALVAGGCGKGKQVDTASYTCGQFNKSLRTKGDNSSGNFVNQLRKQAKLGQTEKLERNEISLGIILSCRGKPASTRPAQSAVKIAKEIKAGRLRLTPPKKRSKK
ncbi:MAG: hypothetical protein ACJ76Z_04130 [Thermoleophilaceae bacterium]